MGFYDYLVPASDYVKTENGATGYRSSGSALVDINFAASSMRSMKDSEIEDLFANAWNEDQAAALRWLFFLRDVRGGMGERRSFRIIFRWLAKTAPEVASALVAADTSGEPLIPHFGRWDDMTDLLDIMPDKVIPVIGAQLSRDIADKMQNAPVSLLAKWLPSVNTSSKQTKARGRMLAKVLGFSERTYRKILSDLRAYIDVIETKMSAGEWDQIRYEAVPSKANIIYSRAFMSHDQERRSAYLASLESGTGKINAKASYPYEICRAVRKASKSERPAFEQMWQDLLQGTDIDRSTIVVADGSYSMRMRVSSASTLTAMDVAQSLALFFAEKLPGDYHGKFITFSESPQYVDASDKPTLFDKLCYADRFNECANTNIEAVFNLILSTAIDNHLTQEQIPECILIISDMEFDSCAEYGSQDWRSASKASSMPLFEVIANRYADHGYTLPQLVFWNICSRTRTVPLQSNKEGVALLSGFSPASLDMAMSGETDPKAYLTSFLMDSRYDCVEEAYRAAVQSA